MLIDFLNIFTTSSLLGQPILPSSNIARTFSTLGLSTTDLFLFSSNQPRNLLTLPQVTQYTIVIIQVGSSLLPLIRGKPSFSRKNPFIVQTPAMGKIEPSWGQPPSFGGQPQPSMIGPNPL